MDNVCAKEFSADAEPELYPAGQIPADRMGMDIGPETQKIYAEAVKDAGTVIWNGPMGVFEFPAFAKGTEAMEMCIRDSPSTGPHRQTAGSGLGVGVDVAGEVPDLQMDNELRVVDVHRQIGVGVIQEPPHVPVSYTHLDVYKRQLCGWLVGLYDTWLNFPRLGLPLRLGLLAAAILLTGAGVCLTVDMELAPNPMDGLVSSLSQATGRSLGLCKNLLDVTCVGVTAALGLLLGGQVLGVGVGTLASMLLTGRVIAGINRAFRQPMRRLAGLEPAGTGEPSAL